MVNLTVICGRDVANLSFSTGGLQVRSLRAAQECTVVTDNETISKVHTTTNVRNLTPKKENFALPKLAMIQNHA